jgi:hypothetical protein
MIIRTDKAFMLDQHTEITPFKYENRRQGFLAKRDGIEFNLTLNLMDTNMDPGQIVLKLYGDAETVNQQIRTKFKLVQQILVGRNYAIVVTIK